MSKEDKKIAFIMDIDGVLTDGTFLYDSEGKKYKRFGPDDADALKMIKDEVSLVFCSADHRGFPISEKRVNDMGYPLNYVKTKERLQWINDNYPKDEWTRIYMGDSFVDVPIMLGVDDSICPGDAHELAKKVAGYVCNYGGGRRAVADAVFHIMKKYLDRDIEKELIGENK